MSDPAVFILIGLGILVIWFALTKLLGLKHTDKDPGFD
jgi:hypothetical protein